MAELKFDSQGLVTAVVQDHLTGEVRMVAWMNQEALDRTLTTGRATFYSRSRKKLWEKGESSGNSLHVRSVSLDCDGDTILLGVDPTGPSCHTGEQSCFFTRIDQPAAQRIGSTPFLGLLERVIAERQSSTSGKSYTKSLLDGGSEAIGAKLREEAEELATALASESNERVSSEAADLLFHLLVGLRLRGVELRSVIEVLHARFGRSGHDEKASRQR